MEIISSTSPSPPTNPELKHGKRSRRVRCQWQHSFGDSAQSSRFRQPSRWRFKDSVVEVYNKGYGSFRGSEFGAGLFEQNISVSSDNFKGPDYVQSGFPARTTTKFELTYTPKDAGSHSATVTFKDYQGNEVKVLVRGVATEPAKVAVDPKVVDAGTLTLGEQAKEFSFNVSNEGKYPLEFVFPKFSDATIEGAAKLHKFGYSVFSNLEGFAPFEYSAAPELVNAVDVTGVFNDNTYLTKPVSLGFSFPYYGKNYDNVYITSYGGLLFNLNTEERFRPPLYENVSSIAGTGLISAYGSQLRMVPESRIEYGWKDGNFVVNFKNVLAPVYNTDYAPVSFHVQLSPRATSRCTTTTMWPEFLPVRKLSVLRHQRPRAQRPADRDVCQHGRLFRSR